MAGNLQEPNPLGNDTSRTRNDVMKGAAQSPHDVKKLRAYQKELKKMQKGLKEEDALFKLLDKDAKKLDRSISRLVKSKSQLTKVADTLTSKLGSSGVSGGITQFSTSALNATTSVNQLDGSMTVLGRSTGISAASFAES